MKFRKLMLCACMMAVLTGCSSGKGNSNNDTADQQENKVELNVYNNLVNEEAEKELKPFMQEANLSNVDTFFSWVNDFNGTMKEDVGLTGQWAHLKDLNYDTTYQNDDMAIAWDETHENQGDSNSRLTSFLLMDGLIKAKDHTDYGSYILMDMDQIESDKMFEQIKPDIYKYSAVFDEVDISSVKTQEEFENAFPNAWTERGVTFQEGKASLINVVLQSPLDNLAFIGHSGVLLQEDGYVLFIEKVDYCNAYQVSKFADRKALVDELKRRTYLVGDESFDMVILENNKVIRG
ncbi:MAG: DUF4300 family protein [bacterium]|nr:DUF4300 family protein [bacterium]